MEPTSVFIHRLQTCKLKELIIPRGSVSITAGHWQMHAKQEAY